MELGEFIKLLSQYREKMEYDEHVEDELFKVTVRCGSAVVLSYGMIKCPCETADDVRQQVYEKVLYELHGKGIQHIIDICGNIG